MSSHARCTRAQGRAVVVPLLVVLTGLAGALAAPRLAERFVAQPDHDRLEVQAIPAQRPAAIAAAPRPAASAPRGCGVDGEEATQRRAVDALAEGRIDDAAACYRTLAARHPDDPALAHAARILERQLGDDGADR